MFSLKNLKHRQYGFEHPETGEVLHVLPPKLGDLDIFNRVVTSKESTMEETAGVSAAVLSNNVEGVEITKGQMMAWMDLDSISAFVQDFYEFLNSERNDDPNC